MEIIELEGYEFIVGMRWQQIDGDLKRPKSEGVSIAKEQGMQYGFIKSVISKNGEGHEKIESSLHQVALCKNKGFVNFVSGAGFIADFIVNNDLLLIEKIRDDTYWVLFISSGEVVSDYDAILSHEDASRVVNDIYSKGVNFDTVSIVADLDILDDLNCNIGIDQIDIEDGLAGLIRIITGENELEQKENKKQVDDALKRNKIVQLYGLPIKLIIGLAGFSVISSIVYAGYNYYVSEQKRQDIIDHFKNLELSLPSSEVFAPNEIVEFVQSKTEDEILAEAKREEVEWLEQKFSSRPPIFTMELFESIVKQIPVEVGGWTLENVALDTTNNPPKTIAFSYKRNMGVNATLYSIKNTLPYIFPFQFTFSIDLKGDKVTALLPVKQPAVFKLYNDDKLFYRNIHHIEQVISKNPYDRYNFINDLQLSQLNWNLVPKNIGTRKIPIEGIKDKSLASQPQLHVRVSNIKVDGKGFDDYFKIKHIVNRSNTTLINRIEFNAADLSWKLDGDFYE